MEDSTAGPGEDRQKQQERAARRIGVAVAVVAIIALLIWLLWPRFGNVPNVIGMTEEQGRAAIQQAGLKVGIVATRTVDSTETGRILGQLPPPGMRVTLGAVVDYTIAENSGVSSTDASIPIAQGSSVGTGVMVPNVVGKSQAEARTTLAGSALGAAVSFTSSGMAVDQVINQFPNAGVFVAANSVIQLTISTGAGMRGAAAVGWNGPSVPDVLGVSASTARSRLNAAGYGARVVYAPSTSTAKGLSFWQSSGPGPESSPPSVIEVWISTGPPSKGAPYPRPPDLAPLNSL